jgi:hypothetical protein
MSQDPKPLDLSRQSQPDDFHLVSVGWAPRNIPGVLDRVAAVTGLRVSHICLKRELDTQPSPAPMYFIRERLNEDYREIDLDLLASLEAPDVPTIRNMILSDRVVRELPYEDGLAYVTFLARRLFVLYEQLAPSVVVGWFDGVHAAVSLAVARKMGIPWFAMHFTALPKGLSAFCAGHTPNQDTVVREPDAAWLRFVAERTVNEFEAGTLNVPVYVSSINLAMVIARIPEHFHGLTDAVRRKLTGTHDRFVDYPLHQIVANYVRKRLNTLTMPSNFLQKPPEQPFVLYALQMQPESSVEVWAPFYSEQLRVVETLARSIPPTYQLLVKAHKSDADNYSRRRFDAFTRLPGVRLVSPFVSSRPFTEKASLVVTITGTIALEAALLGKPVLIYGEHRFAELPTVSTVGRLTELPMLVRQKLTEKPPAREDIIKGFMSYLRCYAESCYNDWSRLPSDAEIDAIGQQYLALREFVLAGSHGRRTIGGNSRSGTQASTAAMHAEERHGSVRGQAI